MISNFVRSVASERNAPAAGSMGHRIRSLRHARRLDQMELAVEAGVSRSALNKWERGERPASAENLARLAEALGTTMDYLWSGRCQGTA